MEMRRLTGPIQVAETRERDLASVVPGPGPGTQLGRGGRCPSVRQGPEELSAGQEPGFKSSLILHSWSRDLTVWHLPYQASWSLRQMPVKWPCSFRGEKQTLVIFCFKDFFPKNLCARTKVHHLQRLWAVFGA